MAIAVNIGPSQHCPANMFYGSRLTDSGGMVIDEVFLEGENLVIGEFCF